MRKAFNLGYRIVSTIVIAFGILLALIYLCGIRLYHVKTGSMGEQIPEGSLCFVSTYSSFYSLKSGDVIAFRVSDDMLVTHRVIEVTKEGVITKGDANNKNDDDPVTKGKYIGKTLFSIPKAGAALASLRKGKGLVGLGIFLALILAAGFFYRSKPVNGEKTG